MMNFIDYFYTKWQEKGIVPFHTFMQEALYAPEVGYYSAKPCVLGHLGDFVTAPELTPLFGRTLARAFLDVLPHCQHSTFLEFGAGTGRLCADILKELQLHAALPERYMILELSGTLRAQQQALIREEVPELFERVQWLSHWPNVPFEGIILANEVLDAMPVHRFWVHETGLLESHIKLNPNHTLEETFVPCRDERLIHHVNALDLKAPYVSEVNLFLESWLAQCSAILTKGVFFILDYGFPQHEYYHPDRQCGTLICHEHHRAHTDFLKHPGEQDITAHVDFTHVATAASHAGFDVKGFTNQAAFLLSSGLLSLLEENNTVKQRQLVQQLINPHEMGELFKVMALTKEWSPPVQGFQLSDKRASL